MMILANVVLLLPLWKADPSVIQHLEEDADNMLDKVIAMDQGPEVYRSLYDTSAAWGTFACGTSEKDNMEVPISHEASTPDLVTGIEVSKTTATAEVLVLVESPIQDSSVETPAIGPTPTKP